MTDEKTYRINMVGTTALKTVTGAEAAMRDAGRLVYPPNTVAQNKAELERTGETNWCYGFAQVVIERVPAASPVYRATWQDGRV